MVKLPLWVPIILFTAIHPPIASAISLIALRPSFIISHSSEDHLLISSGLLTWFQDQFPVAP